MILEHHKITQWSRAARRRRRRPRGPPLRRGSAGRHGSSWRSTWDGRFRRLAWWPCRRPPTRGAGSSPAPCPSIAPRPAPHGRGPPMRPLRRGRRPHRRRQRLAPQRRPRGRSVHRPPRRRRRERLQRRRRNPRRRARPKRKSANAQRPRGLAREAEGVGAAAHLLSSFLPPLLCSGRGQRAISPVLLDLVRHFLFLEHAVIVNEEHGAWGLPRDALRH